MDTTMIPARPTFPYNSHQLSTMLLTPPGQCLFRRPITPFSKFRYWHRDCPTNGGFRQIHVRSDFPKSRPKMFVQNSVVEMDTNMFSTTEIDESGSNVVGVDGDDKLVTMTTNGGCGKINGDTIHISQTSEHALRDSGKSHESPHRESSMEKQGGFVGSDDENCLGSLSRDEESLVRNEADGKGLDDIVLLGDEERRLVLSDDSQASVVVLSHEEHTYNLVSCGDEHTTLVLSGHDQTSGVLLTEENQLAESDEGEKRLVAVGDEQECTVVALGKDDTNLTMDKSIIVGSKSVQQTAECEVLKQELLAEEAHVRRQVIHKLAEKHLSARSKFFIYPERVIPGEDIELILNRSLSALMDEPNVIVMGAFNDWRWKSFSTKMEKSQLSGDWWSCKIHVPKKAYKMDFVFFNGKTRYDNNNRKDFHISVEGGMDVAAFEEFFVAEKQRELKQLKKERAEERLGKDQKQIEQDEAATEITRAQARAEVERGRAQLQDLIKKAETCVENVWYLKVCDSEAGASMVRLLYNRSSRPLAHANEIWIHGGINNWRDGLSITTKMVKSNKKDGDWWHAEVAMPNQAFVMDWVFADGPPQKARMFDNNGRKDFHAAVPESIPDELYWAQEEERIFWKLEEERRVREEAIYIKGKKIAQMRAITKERALKRFLMSQKHIFYTDPLEVKAGENVTVYYNPANTILNGKPEVWFRCCFNRWRHHEGPLAPQKMVPADNGIGHLKTTVKVPLDAYVMDFVFSEKENGGSFDSKNDMDYHVPVYGGNVDEPPMHIVHIAIEMAPIAKVGGLGDVVTSLSRAVQDLNHHVDVILPKYNCLNLSNVKDLVCQWNFPWGGTEIRVWFGKVEGLPVYFLEPCNGFFSSGSIYGCRNDAERFGFFCHAALEFLRQNGSQPDIIHCHDWSSAHVAWLFKEHYLNNGFNNTRVVFTVHNLEYGANFIGKAMHYSDKATTVSHSYSKEVAANPAIASNLHKFHGILNGIDPDIWDPYNDKLIPVSYTSENVVEGKRAAKDTLQRRLGLRVADIPLVGVISRLTHQKGIHLIKHAIWRTLEQDGQFILLGSAPDSRIQHDFVDLGNQLHSAHNDRARILLTYDEPLSHLIYSAADFILVPSMFEPCGLTQLVAMRYGAIPVVRKTGGLYDTVFDVDHDKERAKTEGLEPNGFCFEGADTTGVDYALDRALSTWYNSRDWLNSLCKRVMEQDWSWNRPALDYLELYYATKKY